MSDLTERISAVKARTHNRRVIVVCVAHAKKKRGGGGMGSLKLRCCVRTLLYSKLEELGENLFAVEMVGVASRAFFFYQYTTLYLERVSQKLK